MDFTASSVDRHQRLRALERANRVRSVRAQLKRRIAEGELTAAEVILSTRWEIASMQIAEVLGSQRHWGGERCRGFLGGLRMSETKRIGSMTERQRLATAATLTRSQGLGKQSDAPFSERAAAKAGQRTAY